MAWSSSIRVAYPQARLVSTRQPTTVVIPVDRPVFLIGSGVVAHLRLHSRQVETVHATILNADGRLLLRDLNSEIGVLVNGARLRDAMLAEGDEIEFGKYAFRVELAEADPLSTPSIAPPVAVLSDGRRALNLRAPVCLIGSDPHCDAPLAAELVAPRHALACAANGKWIMRGLVPPNFPRRNGRSKRRWVLQPHDRVGLGAAELIFEIVDCARADVAAPGVVAARAELSDSEEMREVASSERDEVVSSAAPVVHTEIERKPLDSAPPAPSAPGPRVLPIDVELPAPPPPPPPPPPRPPSSPQPIALERDVQPIITDLNDDADDVDDDAASSKASIDFEAIEKWGPLAVAVARADRHELPRAAAGADQHDDAGRPRTPWLLIAIGLILVIGAALFIWFATSRA